MSVYMISYDLNSPTRNRKEVEDSIKSLGAWCKSVSTTFIISTPYHSDYVQNVATKHLDGNDKMVIAKVEKPILGWLEQDERNWIHQNI